MPLLHDGEVLGAVGVSGASSASEDQELSMLAARAIESPCHDSWPAIHLPAADVDIAFANGGLLVDAFRYQVEAAHRMGPGEAERHDTVTDIMRVAAGTATLVTRSCGATLTHELAPGDVVVIPEGVGHEFTAVSEPFRYFVVKVQS
jgi:glc operon protein GlcG